MKIIGRLEEFMEIRFFEKQNQVLLREAANLLAEAFPHCYGDCTAEDMEEYLADIDDLERSYIKEEQKIALRRAMRRLKEEYGQALYLSYFENLSNAEIARIMHKSKRQVENLIYRGKQSLKSELEKEGFVYEEL